jgi:uncharacterized membrane protein
MTRFLTASALAVLSLLLLPVVDRAHAQPGPPGPGAPGGGPGGPGPGGGGTAPPTFSFSVCNASSYAKIFVAVVSRTQQGGFRAQGWWIAPRGGACTKIGDFLRPDIWVHANDGEGGGWGEASVDVCIDLNKSFDFTWDGKARDCKPDETAVGFVPLKVDGSAPGFNWKLND